MMKRALATAALLTVSATLTGCTSSGLAWVGADAITQVASGRSISGNLIHAVMGKDCMPLNALTGKPICPEEEPAKEEVPIYCYRTLGQVDCHGEQDPMMPPTTRLYRVEAKSEALND